MESYNMKTLSTLLLFAFAVPSFAQNAPTETAAAPGCGAENTKFDVKTDHSKHPFVKPEPGKALVYFLQDDSYFLSTPRPTTRFGLDGNWVGATQANAYFYVSVNPGEHHLCAGWQSFVGFNVAQKSAAAHFTAEPGGVYIFVVNDHADRGGDEHQRPAGMKLSALDSDEGQLLMSKFGFSTSRARK
jgi:hypothetical protein